MTSPCACRAKIGDSATVTALLMAVMSQLATAATDTRTGLLTHDAWHPAARRVLRSHASCSLLIIDLDRFKEINDEHGHLIGDQLLAAVAAHVRDAAGSHGGVAGRFGGDEFVALLPVADRATALRHAEHLRRRVETLAIRVTSSGPTARTTVSIGLALTTATDDDLADALWRADAALYAAKAAGRNVVRSAGPPDSA